MHPALRVLAAALAALACLPAPAAEPVPATPLDADEVRTYIHHRLRVAGADGTLEWTDDGAEEVFRCSRGIPRLINLICDRALLACYVFQVKRVDGDIVRHSYQELSGDALVASGGTNHEPH